eukprot:c27652_g1_i1 orf=473-2251(-)
MGGIDEDAPPPFKRMKLASPSSGNLLQEASSTQSVGFADSVMARTLPPSEGETVGSKGLIRRAEFIRIITQALYSLGFEKAAALLEEESGIPLQSPIVIEFRKQILDGRWDEGVTTLQNIGSVDNDTLKTAAFLILQQKFLDLLKKNDTAGALKTLSSEISPLQINKQRLHELACWLVLPPNSELLGTSNNKKCPRLNSRLQLLEELQELLPPSIMIPEKRLEQLVEQALNVQREACLFHNSLDQALSLYTDHRCSRDQIPTQTVQVLDRHENEVWFLQFSHDGRHLASASKDCTAIIWEIISYDHVQLKYTLRGHQKPVSFVAWSPDDSLLLTCGNEEVVKLWDAGTGECKWTFDKPNNSFTACAWFPDGQRFVSGGGDKCIYMWGIDGKELDSWKGERMPRIIDLTVTADGSHLISICEKDIRIYNMDTKVERVIDEEKSITSLSVSKDGRFLLVNLVNQEIHLWDIAVSPKLLFKYKGHRQTRYVIRSCFGGSDHAFIVSGSEDSQVYIWHRGNGELLEVLPGHSGTVNCVSWNPVNPHMFASASDDHTIRIWGLSKSAYKVRGSSTSNGFAPLVNGGPVPPIESLRPF